METGFDFPDLVDEAVQRSGGEQSTAADILSARRSLRLLTERWAAKRYNTWRVKEGQFGLNGVSGQVILNDCVDDVLQVNALTTGVTNETPMSRITATAYAQLTDKGQAGQPSQYWLNRTEPPELMVYPVGNSSYDTVKVWYVERPADFSRYSNDIDDIPGRWLGAIVCGMAADMARKRPKEGGGYDEALIQRLTQEAIDAETIALDADRDRTRFRYRAAGGGRGR